ncbi:MAG: UDP-N-acetylmuramoyl-L-alanine--D-glutamate ligase [Erysipelotrichaceae bacterium]|jgi:UDP-N-acetylmuramoylalanine--D-glutamate ligase|nr:UDP-N-acetylmuramoyl-L-alanine--D-glutamate ligase [Erysipelotrichaceae bacterium]
MSMDAWKKEFENKKILIWGYGMEGRSTYRLIRSLLPEQDITIADGGKGREAAEKETVHTACMDDQNIDLSDYDLIMKAPGIVVKQAQDHRNLSGEAQLFLKHYASHTIGITGTKGKSTTASLVYALLKEKYPAVLVGNIGKACFDEIEAMEAGALAVFEISCHQLEFCPYSPHIGVYLNLYEEHLDHYGTLEKYGNAKFNILKHQTAEDTAVIWKDLPQYISQCHQKTVLIGRDIYAEDRTLYIPEHELAITECALIGDHNYQNLAAAYYIAVQYGISDEQVLDACRKFVPLHHRLEDLGESNGIRYVNDSISTIGQACIQALRSIKNVDTVLIGGMDRGISYTELENYLYERKDVQVIFMYATGHRIFAEMKEKALIRDGLYQTEDLSEAVSLAKQHTRKGHTCLLSPAASSYDHFKNFEERGKTFEQLAFGENR